MKSDTKLFKRKKNKLLKLELMGKARRDWPKTGQRENDGQEKN